jgi:hypothetical protein
VGAGGGFDFVCGLPIVFELEALGIQTFIANLSFTNLSNVQGGIRKTETLLQVDADCLAPAGGYFPEGYLANWFRQYKNKEMPVWCLSPAGVGPITQNYNLIIAENQIDTVICVDGGIDGIFRGDESELGTPSMDAASVIAASLCTARNRYYVCTAFGIDGAESGVSHAQVLNRMADLVQMDAMLGVGMVLKNTAIGKNFLHAASYIHNHMEYVQHSTIVSAIMAAMSGVYGYTAVNGKTQQNKVWLSPLTALYWYFDADDVARMKLYYSRVCESKTVAEISAEIQNIRSEKGVASFENIPI